MADAFTVLTWAMWFFMIFFLVAGISSITWDRKHSKKKSLTKTTAVLSFYILLITIARFVIGIIMGNVEPTNFILIMIWLFATVMQIKRIIDRSA